MNADTKTALLEWLLASAGPIIRWRLVTDFALPVSKKELAKLRTALLATDEVKRWLDNLGSGSIHGSKDTDAENAMAKLVEFGLRAGVPELDDKMLPYADKVGQYQPSWLSAPFLIAAGYATHKVVRKWFLGRLDALYEVACKRDYDLYLSPERAGDLPKAWQGKMIYKPRYFSEELGLLPTCYDLYALAHWPHTPETRKKAEVIVSFVSRPEFQTTPGGYFWDQAKNRCYAAGRAWLACCEPQRVVLFLELAARFGSARKSAWFKEALSQLERHRTDAGTYCFPSDLLKETKNSYYIYQGAHMGLGENRRKRDWRELESTFRMLNIKRLMEL